MKLLVFSLSCIVFLLIFYTRGGGSTLGPAPANAATVVVSNITQGWLSNKQRNIFYNGTNFFVFYNKGSTSLFARSASTIAGLASASEVTIVSADMASNTEWEIYQVDDTKFDVVYINTSNTSQFKVITCSITSGTTITTPCAGPAVGTASSAIGDVETVRTPSANRIWVEAKRSSGSVQIFDASSATGDATSGMTFTSVSNSGSSAGIDLGSMVPYTGSDKILYVNAVKGSNANSTGYDGRTCTTASCASATFIVKVTQNAAKMGNVIRVSDTDFRFVYVDDTATTKLTEAKFDGTSTWTAAFATIDSGGGQLYPSLFYDRTSGDEYVFYADSATPTSIQRYRKPSGSAWETTKTDVDAGEADNNSMPVTQMHEAPLGSARTVPRELSWCYRNVNVSNFDIVCDHLNLASAGSLSLTAPGSATMTSVTLATTTQTSTGSLGTTTVNDTRGTNVGWSLTVTCNNFTASTHTIAATNLTINPSNSTLTVVSGSGTGVTAGASHTFTSTVDSATVMTASNGNGNGQYTINPGLSLNVPVGSYAGSYSTTVTETLL